MFPFLVWMVSAGPWSKWAEEPKSFDYLWQWLTLPVGQKCAHDEG